MAGSSDRLRLPPLRHNTGRVIFSIRRLKQESENFARSDGIKKAIASQPRVRQPFAGSRSRPPSRPPGNFGYLAHTPSQPKPAEPTHPPGLYHRSQKHFGCAGGSIPLAGKWVGGSPPVDSTPLSPAHTAAICPAVSYWKKGCPTIYAAPQLPKSKYLGPDACPVNSAWALCLRSRSPVRPPGVCVVPA